MQETSITTALVLNQEFAKIILEVDPRRDEQRLKRLNPIPTTDYPTPAKRPAYSVLDNTKFQKYFWPGNPFLENGAPAGDGGPGVRIFTLKETLLEKVIPIALRAGEAVMAVYRQEDLGIQSKEDYSPLTRADTASHKIILEGLSRLASELPVLSEESAAVPYEERKRWQRYWLVDPLDGTKEFINRNNEFTVNIALIEDQRPVLGVVYAPALDKLCYAASGIGAYTLAGGQEEPLKTLGYTGGGVKVVASKTHRSPELEVFLEKLGNAECVSMGSSLKFCLVAEGKAHLYPRLGPTMEWDTAAAQCIVECAGGQVTDLRGAPLIYNKENLLNPYFMACGSPPFPWQNYLII